MKHILNVLKRNNVPVFETDFMIRINFLLFVINTKKILIAQNDFDLFLSSRCLVDANFAHIKRLYKRTDSNSLGDLREIVDRSCYSNNAVLFEEEDSWIWSDWAEFFSASFSALMGLRGYHIFRFHQENPGKVFCRKPSDDIEQDIKLLKGSFAAFDPNVRPRMVFPGGLTRDRQAYLYSRVRPVEGCYLSTSPDRRMPDLCLTPLY